VEVEVQALNSKEKELHIKHAFKIFDDENCNSNRNCH
jgi:hypothetical protein